MSTTEKKDLVTYCGLYCGACDVYKGSFKEAAGSLQGLLEAYGVAQWAPEVAQFVPALKSYSEFEGVLGWLANFDCQGCLAGGGPPQCNIRICAKERNLAGCWECAELPCEKRQWIDDDHSDAVDNCRRIQEVGLEAWLAEQPA